MIWCRRCRICRHRHHADIRYWQCTHTYARALIGGIHALEAMLYTLDKINGDKILLPNITIGAHVLDDCDRDSYGLEMAVDFIKGMFELILQAINMNLIKSHIFCICIWVLRALWRR